jgi:hypothetical protein
MRFVLAAQVLGEEPASHDPSREQIDRRRQALELLAFVQVHQLTGELGVQGIAHVDFGAIGALP